MGQLPRDEPSDGLAGNLVGWVSRTQPNPHFRLEPRHSGVSLDLGQYTRSPGYPVIRVHAVACDYLPRGPALAETGGQSLCEALLVDIAGIGHDPPLTLTRRGRLYGLTEELYLQAVQV